jgi:hypothetical protein
MKNEPINHHLIEDGKPSLDEVVDALLRVVDSEFFPNAWAPQVDIESVCFNASAKTLASLIDPEPQNKINKFLEAMPYEVREEIDVAITLHRTRSEVLPIAAGLALGLRTAGISKPHAAMILRAFLRNYGRAGGGEP